ncbi:MAG TPA: PfkB family carbohydrate kinase [Solirubrobacteraceae bacterium]|nr:PfkB family carbohydrate kinase [Solirubrobacteraceae bacterium]
MAAGGPKVGVVGHVEWVQFANVPHVPLAGEVVHASAPFEEPAGGGAVAAVQLARLAGAAGLFTALGGDEHGERSIARLTELGVAVHTSRLPDPTRRAVTLIDGAGERTITTLGARLEPHGERTEIGWEAIAGSDAVYFTAGDVAALRAARAGSRVLVASPRARDALGHGVPIDVLVLSGEDRIERRAASAAEPDAELVVLTDGARGGTWRSRSGETGSWAPGALPGPVADSYGCGDSFAGGLTFGLAAGLPLAGALDLAARCGAVCLTGRGPYQRQLTAADLDQPRT